MILAHSADAVIYLLNYFQWMVPVVFVTAAGLACAAYFGVHRSPGIRMAVGFTFLPAFFNLSGCLFWLSLWNREHPVDNIEMLYLVLSMSTLVLLAMAYLFNRMKQEAR